MYCPTCKDTVLKPTKIEHGLPVKGCAKCGGALISLLHYRDWREHDHFDSMEKQELSSDIIMDDSKDALTCPICNRLMTKYRISSETSNRLDLCLNCDEAWLDNGEWTLLKSLEISDKLPKVFTDAWQYKLRTEVNKRWHRKHYLDLLGEEDLLEAERIRDWIAKHPKRNAILNIVNGGK